MKPPLLSTETVHATAVSIGGRAVLLAGRSGSGKSDLGLRLIDRGAALISDDYTVLRRAGGEVRASAPATIHGKLEVRGLGILAMTVAGGEPAVALFVDLDEPAERMPTDEPSRMILGVAVPIVRLDPWTASAPIKVELALRARP